MQQQTIVAGVDTGGTFTDAVILGAGGRVLARAKRPTRHHDLEAGTVEALGAALEQAGVPGSSIAMVGVSTTLATNSVVEGRGARVGLFQIGVRKPVPLPVVGVEFVQGGHLVGGAEEAPLDVQALVGGVRRFQGHVDAYAVAASGSCFNPAHELVAAKAVSMLDPLPVSCAHEVSELPSHEERLATVALNAGLLPVMKHFLERLQAGLAGLGVAAPVRVVCGDCESLTPDQAVHRPLSTFAAGPAASALYGAREARRRGNADALVLDVGGTTTDLVTMRNSVVPVRSGGSVIGRWETHVRAVELRTVGIGGDSHVRVERGALRVGPRRVRPLALLGEEALTACVLDLFGRQEADRVVLVPPECAQRAGEAADRSPLLRHLLTHGPSTAGELTRVLGRNLVELEHRLEELARRRLLVEAGFTPSDALHVLGRAGFGNADASRSGAEVLGGRLGTSAQNLAAGVMQSASRDIEDALVEHLLRCELGHDMAGLVRRRRELRLLRLDVRPMVPVVVLGAAGKALLADLDERLGAELIFPEEHEVGNAVGAALVAAQAAAQAEERTATTSAHGPDDC
jgi:N-methylhydantoinase A/oxoprolinase/acetone carboxylase beta subunit